MAAFATTLPRPWLLVLEAAGVIDLDYTGSQELKQLADGLKNDGCVLAIARLEAPRAAAAAEATGLVAALGREHFFRTVEDVFALYVHLHPGSLTVKVGEVMKAGAPLAKIGNTGPSMGPHLHFGLSDKPDFFAGRSLPFVFDSFTLVGAVDFDTSEGIEW